MNVMSGLRSWINKAYCSYEINACRSQTYLTGNTFYTDYHQIVINSKETPAVTRMHTCRMRTARFDGRHWLYLGVGVYTTITCPSACWDTLSPSAQVHAWIHPSWTEWQTDVKHYLLATWFAGGKYPNMTWWKRVLDHHVDMTYSSLLISAVSVTNLNEI